MGKISLFLDSGAFSAWSLGKEVNLDDYIAYCLEHMDKVEAIANLDVIPGRPFQKITPADIENSAKQGWENYERMLAAGIPKDKLIHIFHQGEDFKWLKRMVDEIPYIGLSPANDKTTAQKEAWLDECMQYVLDANGYPRVKFHGFAVTSLRLMLRYPWYSVDSTTWNVYARYGAILVPHYRKGQWIYDERAMTVFVSSRSTKKGDPSSVHIETMRPKERDIVLEYIHSKGYKLGKSHFKMVPQSYELAENEVWAEKKPADPKALRKVEVVEEPGLSNDYSLRGKLNITYFQDLQKSIPPWPRQFKGMRMGRFTR